MTDDKPFLIYGATGYTGRLTARLAVDLGMRPTLAGRSREKVEALATELKLPWLAFALDGAASGREGASAPRCATCRSFSTAPAHSRRPIGRSWTRASGPGRITSTSRAR